MLFASPREAGERRKNRCPASETALIPGADQRTVFLVALVDRGKLTSLHQNARESFLAVEGGLGCLPEAATGAHPVATGLKLKVHGATG